VAIGSWHNTSSLKLLFSWGNGPFKTCRWPMLAPLFYLINELAWSDPVD